eukprot:2818411-Prymnesium_polylepis.1
MDMASWTRALRARVKEKAARRTAEGRLRAAPEQRCARMAARAVAECAFHATGRRAHRSIRSVDARDDARRWYAAERAALGGPAARAPPPSAASASAPR